MKKMDRDGIYLAIKAAFDDVFDYDGPLGDETVADDVPGWDSIGHVRMILAVERKLGIRFLPSEVADFKNLGDLVALINAKTG